VSAVLAVLAYVGICATGLGIGIWLGGAPERRRRRGKGAVRENSQLETTQIHHVPPAKHPTPSDRPRARAKKDEEGQR
jgi:hypothetical protein